MCLVQLKAQPRHTGRVSVDDLECSALEKALKEQVYRLAGQWEQGKLERLCSLQLKFFSKSCLLYALTNECSEGLHQPPDYTVIVLFRDAHQPLYPVFSICNKLAISCLR